jgi:NAD(P)-dependent dehydrogenase (short-subunit alcohol dehydrogenase family)
VTRTDDTDVPDYPGLLRLDGRRFVVIGAGQGIGRQASHALAQAGARLVVVDKDPDLAADIAAEVDATAWSGDATDRDEVARLASSAVDALGGIDGLVDIIGMAQYASLLDVSDEIWEWEHDICLRHAWLAMQTLGKAMTSGPGGRAGEGPGGAMVFVASVSGMTGAPLHAAYGAFKAGLIGLVRSAAVELGPLGVRVNAVAPGVVWTPRVSAFLGEEGRRRNSDNAPLRRVALPADIAGALLFLASDLSGYVNGQTLVVDGGVGVKFPYPLPEEATS